MMLKKTGKLLSKWVDDVWKENCSHAVNLNSVKDLYEMNEHTFIVWDVINKSHTWKVYYLMKNCQNVNVRYSYLQRYV